MGVHGFESECCVQSVARVCVELGFDTAEESALEAVADVVRYFVSSLAARTHGNMIHSQRTKVALNDVLAAFRQAPSARVSWRSLEDFAFRANDRGWNLPSHINAPELPVPGSQRRKACRLDDDGGGRGEKRSKLIPSFLPPFPPVHTYRRVEEREEEENVVAQEEKGQTGEAASAAESGAGTEVVREREALQLALNRISRHRRGDAPIVVDDEADKDDRVIVIGEQEED